VFCKWHLKTQQGIRNLLPEEAVRLAGTDTDHAQRDLFNAIAQGNFPSWNVSVQIMTEAEAARYHNQSVRPHEGLASQGLPPE